MLRAPPLGRLLLDVGVLDQKALDEVLTAQKTDKRRLGELLVEKKLVRPEQLAQVLSQQLSCPWISLARVEIPPNVIALIPKTVAEEFHVVPVYMRTTNGVKTLYVATDDPTDEDALAECAFSASMKVRPMVAVTSDVAAALAKFYGIGDAKPAPPPKPAPPASRVTLPEIPPSVAKTPEPAEDIEDVELVPASTDKPVPKPARTPKVITLNAPERFLAQCKQAAQSLGAEVIDAKLVDAASALEEHRPCAVVVTEDVYAFDRATLNRLALDIDAVLVVWSDDVEGKQLAPLLEGAVERWKRSSYEKGTFVELRYELLRDIGGKVHGSRWEVRHSRTLRRSMLKVGVRAADDESDAQAVEREQAALALVHHPAAVDLRDAGKTELGDPYVVVELVEGRTIEGLVAARERLPPWDVCSIFHQIADCLSAAHAAGVVHGDVRPENVVVTRDGYGVERAKLINWEQATTTRPGPAANAEVDVRAVGECLFHAMVGRRRAPGEDVSAAVAEAGVGPTLAGVIERAAGNEGPDRFTTMKDLAAALETAEPRARDATHLLEASARERRTAPPPAAAEQRRFVRAPYRTPIRIEVPGVGAVDGRSEDISEGGLLVVTREAVAQGTAITLRFALPIDGKVVSEPAVVKWSRAAAIGVALDSPAPETRRQIERYVSLMGDEKLSRPE